MLNGERTSAGVVVGPEILKQCLSKKSLLYDKNGEEHYNLISALHKSMRNSDPDAAIYWLARMLEGGEDPLYIARRLIRFASEDVGMADSRAIEIATAVYQACHFIGMPECSVHLTHAVTYLSLAPKSNALYVAYETAKRDALEMLDEPVPLQIRNAPHPPDEGPALRRGVSIRPRHRGQAHHHAMPSRRAAGEEILHPHRAGFRSARAGAPAPDRTVAGAKAQGGTGRPAGEMTLFAVGRLCPRPVRKRCEQDGREKFSRPFCPLEDRTEAFVSIRGLLVRPVPAKTAGRHSRETRRMPK